MVYKILFGGRGADLIIHNLDEQKKQKLVEMDITKKDCEIDFDKLNHTLGVDNWDYGDESWTGTYASPECCHITVFRENNFMDGYGLVWESDDDFLPETGEEDEDCLELEKKDILLIEHSIKGSIKEYSLDIEGIFDPNKLTAKYVEINEEVGIIVDLKYDGKLLVTDEWGDYWSKATYFYLY